MSMVCADLTSCACQSEKSCGDGIISWCYLTGWSEWSIPMCTMLFMSVSTIRTLSPYNADLIIGQKITANSMLSLRCFVSK